MDLTAGNVANESNEVAIDLAKHPENQLTVIGISGKRYAGKSMLGGVLQKVDDRYNKLALAMPMKVNLFDLIHKDLAPDRVVNTLPEEKIAWVDEHKPMLRVMLQQYGTNVMRELGGQDIWVKTLVKALRQLPGRVYVIVDDVRFPNEVTGLEAWADQSYFIRLHISPEVQAARAAQAGATIDPETANHPSETALDDHYDLFDLVIDADHNKHAVCEAAIQFLLDSEIDFAPELRAELEAARQAQAAPTPPVHVVTSLEEGGLGVPAVL